MFNEHLKQGQDGGVKEIKWGFSELEILQAIYCWEIKGKARFIIIIFHSFFKYCMSRISMSFAKEGKWLDPIQQDQEQVPAEPASLLSSSVVFTTEKPTAWGSRMSMGTLKDCGVGDPVSRLNI